MPKHYLATIAFLLIVAIPHIAYDSEVGHIYNEEISVVCDSLEVDITWYTSTVEECDDTPFITADGSRVRHGIVALSRDLLEHLDYGDSLYVENIGWYEARDTMHRRWRNRIDVWCDDRSVAINNGIQQSTIKYNFREVTSYKQTAI